MATHTPGPWTFTDADNKGWMGIYSEDCRTVADVVAQLPGETAANARLIAAAPDLLEALRNLIYGSVGKGSNKNWQAALSAIAKAEGRE